MQNKNNKKQLGQIIAYISKDKKSLDIFSKVVNKLEKLGYELEDEDIEEEIDGEYDFFFLHIDKDEKLAYVDSSILIPSCMANVERNPIPIKWMHKLFDKIMSNSTYESFLKALERRAFIENSKKS